MQTIPVQSAKPSGCAAILDPISLNRAVRQAFKGLDRGTSLFSFAAALLFTLATGTIWWQYDLLSTWAFTQGVQVDTQPAANMLVEKAQALADANAAMLVGGLLAIAYTLTPSIAELIAPRVMHPGVQLALNIAIAFDFVTDWPQASAIVQQYNVPGGWIGWLFVTAVVTLAISLFVQVLFILGLTVLITSGINLMMGGEGDRKMAIPFIIDQ